MDATSDVMPATAGSVELVRELFEKINQRNVDVLCEHWTDDIVDDFPFAMYRGHTEVREFWAELFAAVPDFHIRAEKIVGEGNTVFVHWRWTGTATGAPWRGIESNGSRLDMQGIDCFTVRDGKISKVFVVFDQLNFARQIGLMPREGSFADRMMVSGFNARTRLRRRLGLG